MKKLLLLFAVAFILPQGCDSKKNTKVNAYDEIMAIHDAVMPKMGEVHRSKRDLQKLIPSLTDSTQVAQINYSIGELEEADNLMQDWMHNWAEKSKGMDKKSSEYQQFLKEQKKSIINVSDRIYHAMEHSNETLAKHQKK